MLAAPDSAPYFIGQNLQRFAVFFEESIIPKFYCSKKKKKLKFCNYFFSFFNSSIAKSRHAHGIHLLSFLHRNAPRFPNNGKLGLRTASEEIPERK